MTLGEARAFVVRRLEEVAGASAVFWSSDDIDNSLNEGYAEISDASEWLEKSGTVSWTSANTDRYFDMFTELEQCYLNIGPAFNNTTSRWLHPTHTRLVDEADSRWGTRGPGESDYLFMRNLWWVRYHPRPTTGSILQYYIAIPTRLCMDSDTPGFPAQFHQGLVEYALYDLWSQDGETDLALEAWGEYLRYEAALTDFRKSRISTARRGSWKAAI